MSTTSKQRPRPARVVTRVPRVGDETVRLPSTQGPPPSVLGALSSGEGTPLESESGVSPVRYRVQEEIGRGGMGRILRVEDADLNREVAMKVLLRDEKSGDVLRRFIEEAQITGQLEHPGILPVHDLGMDGDGQLFFTMQYCRSNVTLDHIIERLRAEDPEAQRRWTFERRAQLIQKVCQVLDYAHERGVVHRDIKPSNVMVGLHGEVYLLDWGVAKLLDVPEEDRPKVLVTRQEDHEGTQDGVLIGTPAYMAPEQVLGEKDAIGPRSDVYALTAVLFELLTLNYYLGDFEGKSMSALVSAVVHRQGPDAEDFIDPCGGRVPRALSRICRKGLAKRPENRFQSARELESALQDWLEGNAPVVCPGTAMQRGLSSWSRLIDRHPFLVPAVTIPAVILLTSWTLTATWIVLRTW